MLFESWRLSVQNLFARLRGSKACHLDARLCVCVCTSVRACTAISLSLRCGAEPSMSIISVWCSAVPAGQAVSPEPFRRERASERPTGAACPLSHGIVEQTARQCRGLSQRHCHTATSTALFRSFNGVSSKAALFRGDGRGLGKWLKNTSLHTAPRWWLCGATSWGKMERCGTAHFFVGAAFRGVGCRYACEYLNDDNHVNYWIMADGYFCLHESHQRKEPFGGMWGRLNNVLTSV